MKDGLYNNISDTAYHGDTVSLSSTGARLLLPPSCPAKFKEWRDNPPTPKPQFDIGHVVHRLVLGKGSDIVEIEAPDYRGKDARDARDKAHVNDQAPVLTHELVECRRMAGAVIRHPVAGPIFTSPKGDAEVSFYATDPATGVQLRCRVDWLHYNPDGRLWCLDLKTSTTANPVEFVRKAADWQYHFQAAWYLGVIGLLKLAVDPVFLFAVVEKTPPYLVSVVEFDAEAIAEGRRLNRQAIDLYHDCHANNTWPGYDADITPISLPPWAFRAQPTLNDLITLEN